MSLLLIFHFNNICCILILKSMIVSFVFFLLIPNIKYKCSTQHNLKKALLKKLQRVSMKQNPQKLYCFRWYIFDVTFFVPLLVVLKKWHIICASMLHFLCHYLLSWKNGTFFVYRCYIFCADKCMMLHFLCHCLSLLSYIIFLKSVHNYFQKFPLTLYFLNA